MSNLQKKKKNPTKNPNPNLQNVMRAPVKLLFAPVAGRLSSFLKVIIYTSYPAMSLFPFLSVQSWTEDSCALAPVNQMITAKS